jgi:D-cysteine desulfhydrase family pyridoxal phosphate-dependent enzyme
MSLGVQPRLRLAFLPTPLHEAVRLREALGGPARSPRILLKRDDLTGLAFGGNKARKLEFLVGDALRQGATVLVTTGAAQSNHARMTAAAACIAGMKSALVLTSDADSPPPQGNLLLDRLLGAEVHFTRTSQYESAAVAEVIDKLRSRGERPYLIPIGGSSATGALGYVAGTLELVGQLFQAGEAPTRLYYPSGSRGTQAGLALGAKLYSAPYQLYGIAVSPGEPEKTQRALRIAGEAAALLNAPARLEPADLLTDGGYLGPGYGIPTPECLEAIHLLARTEGVFLDPVYTAKAMAGLMDHVRRGVLDPASTVVFLHTGGTPALFVHRDVLMSSVPQ